MTDGPTDDVPRSPSGRVPQWVLDEATGPPSAPSAWRAAPSTHLHEPRRPRRWMRRGRNTATTLVVAAVLALVIGWTATGHPLLPEPTGPVAAAGATPSGAASPTPTITPHRDAPPAGLGEAAAPLGTPAALSGPASDSFRILVHQPHSTDPVTFSPCRAIHYVVRSANTPPGGAAMITRAILAVSQATGLRFVDDGPSTEPVTDDRDAYQPARYGDKWAPVLIAFATKDEVPDFSVDIAGEASPQIVQRADGQLVMVSGHVYLDAAEGRQLRREGRGAIMAAIVEHELGHLVGLAHVNDKSQLMYPRASGKVLRYGSGDLAGLAELGQGPCAPDV